MAGQDRNPHALRLKDGGDLPTALDRRGISRREFLKFCSMTAATLALPAGKVSHLIAALQSVQRPPLVWLELQDCAGCTESLLRASRPTVAGIVLDVLSVDYHETIMAAAGHQAEEAKEATTDAGGHLVVVEGSIPLLDDGIYCCIGGRTAIDILDDATRNADAVIAVGNCATFGGIPAAYPNPTRAVSVSELVDHIPVLNLPGCPLNVVNLTATVVHYLTFGALPDMDDLGRPLFAFGQRIHDNCERRGHFDAGEFVREWGDEGHRLGWCLYQMGCKGPVTYHNCPSVRWNEGTSWPVGSGHGCIGCSQPGFWEFGAYNTVEIFDAAPPTTFPAVEQEEPAVSPGSAALISGLAGLAAGAAGATAARQLSKSEEE